MDTTPAPRRHPRLSALRTRLLLRDANVAAAALFADRRARRQD